MNRADRKAILLGWETLGAVVIVTGIILDMRWVAGIGLILILPLAIVLSLYLRRKSN